MPPSVKTETEGIEEDNVTNPITTTVSAPNTASMIQTKQEEEQEEENGPNKKTRIEEDNNSVICILSDDDESVSDGTINLLDDDDDDEVIVVEPTKLSTKDTGSNIEEQIDDDIVAVRDSMMKLPHMRQHCTVHKVS